MLRRGRPPPPACRHCRPHPPPHPPTDVGLAGDARDVWEVGAPLAAVQPVFPVVAHQHALGEGGGEGCVGWGGVQSWVGLGAIGGGRAVKGVGLGPAEGPGAATQRRRRAMQCKPRFESGSCLALNHITCRKDLRRLRLLPRPVPRSQPPLSALVPNTRTTRSTRLAGPVLHACSPPPRPAPHKPSQPASSLLLPLPGLRCAVVLQHPAQPSPAHPKSTPQPHPPTPSHPPCCGRGHTPP